MNPVDFYLHYLIFDAMVISYSQRGLVSCESGIYYSLTTLGCVEYPS